MRKTVRILAAVVAAALVVVPAGVAQARPAAGSPAASIDWAPCDEDPSAECGTLTVPVDWANPGGETLELALSRRPATDPSARIGSLLVNPGGPGGSGVDFVIWGYPHFSAELQQKFDIVGFDPRGVGRSNPVMCGLDVLLDMPGPLLADQADFDRRIAFNHQLTDDCRGRTGQAFDFVDTLSVVDDLDAIRAALRERKLNFYGVSYGTLIGQQYAERYPHRVRSVALVGNMDHSGGTRQFLEDQAEATQLAFDAFVDWCDRTAACALHGEDVRQVWGDLRAQARRGELLDPFFPDETVTEFGLISIAFGYFYGPDWPYLAEELALMRAGVPAAASRSTSRQDDQSEVLPYGYPAIFCQDYHLPVRDFRQYDRFLKRQAKIAPDMGYSPLAMNDIVTCLGWKGEVRNPQQPLRVPRGPKLLLVNSVSDPATGHNWAVAAARQLGDSAALLTYEGGGHSVYRASDCVTGAVDDYLVSGVLPASGASCPAVDPTPMGVQSEHRPPRPGPHVLTR